MSMLVFYLRLILKVRRMSFFQEDKPASSPKYLLIYQKKPIQTIQ
jgi:hypothetical protein